MFLGLWPPLLCSADGELHIIESVSKLVIKQFEWQRHMNRTRLNTRERERAREREREKEKEKEERRERESSLIPACHSMPRRAASTTFGTCSACCDTLSGGGHQGTMETIPQKLQDLFWRFSGLPRERSIAG